MNQSPPQAPSLVVDGAEKRFGDVVALAGASLSVERGELVGLLGPNGAGKTTLIKAIAGRLALDAGAIRLFGRNASRDDKRPDVGVVPQELAIYGLLTARENLEVFGKLAGVPKSKLPNRVAWALEWSGLADRSSESVKRFSGGMKRRLNIACGLLHEPKLVLLDEPTVGVDPQSRERIYDMLSVLEHDGVSVVLTTHHIEEAERRCRRIVIIDHGKTVGAGTVAELVGRTIGHQRTVVMTLAAPLDLPSLPNGMTRDPDGRSLRAAVVDVSRDVSARLAEAESIGAKVIDIQLSGMTLQDAFIALTGRELRE